MAEQKVDLETKLEVNAVSIRKDVIQQQTEFGILTSMQFAAGKNAHVELEQICIEEQAKVIVLEENSERNFQNFANYQPLEEAQTQHQWMQDKIYSDVAALSKKMRIKMETEMKDLMSKHLTLEGLIGPGEPYLTFPEYITGQQHQRKVDLEQTNTSLSTEISQVNDTIKFYLKKQAKA